MGLPISRNFVQLMGGDIQVSSQVGQGSQFRFTVQVNRVESTQLEAVNPVSKKVLGLAANQPTYRLLVVEDSMTNRLLLVKLLSSLGFEVKEATNGQEALTIWETWHPHLIWMDMQMPVMNGYDATRKIKASAAGQSTIIIALTASAFEEQRQAMLSAGCDDFVRKPFRRDNLLQKLAQHLQVEYLYEEEPDAIPAPMAGGAFPNRSLPALSADRLTIMPLSWIEELHEAALQCSDYLILELIRQIPLEQVTLVNTLTQMVENFRFDRLAVLAQAARTAASAHVQSEETCKVNITTSA